MTINELVCESHTIALDHGWWQQPRSIGEVLALVHSEVSEALEDWRNGDMEIANANANPGTGWKPVGFPIELADILIRVADLAGFLGIDLDHAVTVKLAYNRTRPFRHGGKLA